MSSFRGVVSIFILLIVLFSINALSAESAAFYSNKEALIDKDTTRQIKESPEGRLNLLPFLDYDPEERMQGECRNSWVWAATAMAELALNVQEGIRDRLSIQFFNSNYKNEDYERRWACNIAGIAKFVEFYETVKFFIPWSNENAFFQDDDLSGWEIGLGMGGGSNVDPDKISTKIYYPIESIEWEEITTSTVGRKKARENIKEQLQQGKAVWFPMIFPRLRDRLEFALFWNLAPEKYVWKPSFDGRKTRLRIPSAQAFVIVGYDETNRKKPYWIVLNSMGTANGRKPAGTFRLSMKLNYRKTKFRLPSRERIPAYYFKTLNIDFGNNDGLRVSPVRGNSIRIGNIGLSEEFISAGETLETTTYLENNENYMNLKNVRITYIIPDLGIRKRVGPFDLKRNKDVLKKINLEIPPDTPPGEYDLRITVSNGQFNRVKYRVITVV